ncbi:Allergen V5/Tpx-1-related protein [Cordyceps fumosorosea ARSEF 2679]|uniref:Allergen V5/Tpx-1-related protein n=1 Tax=Cordyceps fumosorosea (strain ARSEF 2679) TaxID=1081104 RepID=A0A162MTW2_CORFA|nr:Allergen V5/Tpx-1-related protein [Cordyceps fumosorosea ARSEF 2679]OAA70289.1 Allergen V5/Tpx-1-related protein [Cordyceps fumosorosea ARSEF 2679]
MFTSAVTKTAVLALVAVGAVSSAPLETRDRDDFKNKMLEGTNWYRSQHGAKALSWDQDLEDYAANYARACLKQHSRGPHGENLDWYSYWGSPASYVNDFGRERINFDFNNGGFDKSTGHFTQLVWKDTSRMGCAWADCSSWYNIVCEYERAGNIRSIEGDNRFYRENVGRQVWGNIKDEFQG